MFYLKKYVYEFEKYNIEQICICMHPYFEQRKKNKSLFSLCDENFITAFTIQTLPCTKFPQRSSREYRLDVNAT